MTSQSIRSGYVAIVGWPNVGKSTLMNSLVGQKVSIVSSKPQTTREALIGILNEKENQLIFVDTPGWIKPADFYQSIFRKTIIRTIREDSDVILWVRETRQPSDDEQSFFGELVKTGKPLVIAHNKIDLTQPEFDAATTFPNTKVVGVSAKTLQGITKLKAELVAVLPVHPPYFSSEQVSDRWERYFVAEMVREHIFSLYHEEVPHASFVKTESFQEREGEKDHIELTITVETEGQKRIVIGHGGQAIKQLGQRARQDIEKWLGRPIFLGLKVKVHKNWREDGDFLRANRSDHYY